MLKPKQAEKLSGSRNAIALSHRPGKEREHLALRFAQGGIPDALAFSELKQLATDLHQSSKKSGFEWIVVIGVSFDQWTRWSQQNDIPMDEKLFNGWVELHQTLQEHQPPYALDHGELFFHIQAFEQEKAEEITELILSKLDKTIDKVKTNCTFGDSLHSGRIYGGRMLHGVISSVDPVDFSARAIIGDEVPQQKHKGGCFCLTQRFIHDCQRR
jgi:deferrochelatase/peroxidase EfeB